MEQSGRNTACVVPDNLSFFDSEYGEYTHDLEYISQYIAEDVQRYFNLNQKNNKNGLVMYMGLREDLTALNNAVGAVEAGIANQSSVHPTAGHAHHPTTTKQQRTAVASGLRRLSQPSSTIGG